MPIMFPDPQKTRVVFASRAEESFFKECQNQLSTDWRVYYSCTLSKIEKDKGLVDNEIDFVLYHKKYGLIVLEVKGGRIRFDPVAGRFFSINRFNKSYRIKNPFQQALQWKSRFVRFLRSKDIKCPVGHGIVFPNANESEFPESGEMEPALIIGIDSIKDLEKSLIRLAKKTHPERFLSFEDVGSSIDQILQGANFSTKFHLRDYIDSHERMVKDVEVIHETLVLPLAGSSAVAVEGEAGTGKTMLAVMLAQHFRNQGKSVLFLSSSSLLNDILSASLGEGVKVQTYAEFASSFGVEILRRPSGFEGSREDWIQFEGPDQLKKAIEASSARYDVLLCDEGQDVQPFWWESIEAAISSADDRRFYIFFDRSQGVFGSGGAEDHFVPEDVLPIKAPYFCVVHNYRTTKEIAAFSREFRTGTQILHSHAGRLGFKPRLVTYRDHEDFKLKLDGLLKDVLDLQGVSPHEVTLLSGRSPFGNGSSLKEWHEKRKNLVFDLGTSKNRGALDHKDSKEKVRVSTIASFKGLETSVGIVCNLSEYNLPMTHPIMRSLFYVASTRAKHMLFVMVKEGDEKHLKLQEALDQIEEKGEMILDRSIGPYEFDGVVSYYDPNRYGWLKVEDSGFDQSQVLFFPHDLEQAGVKDIKVGQRFRFRPRSEGGMTVATSLKATSSSLNKSG